MPKKDHGKEIIEQMLDAAEKLPPQLTVKLVYGKINHLDMAIMLEFLK
jgi:hypothetical protein